MKELRRRATEVARRSTEQSGGGEMVSWPFPSEEDEATLCYCDNENKVMRATVCCDERSSLNRDMMQAIRSVQVRVVRAETMTLGGRTKNVVVMEWSGGGREREEEFMGLRRALKAVVENRAQSVLGNKRARACCPMEDTILMCWRGRLEVCVGIEVWVWESFLYLFLFLWFGEKWKTRQALTWESHRHVVCRTKDDKKETRVL